ncbi:MAG: tRNA uridine-5-carboxymethylaminomethyl(34) synthesis GTPase MnmE [Gammaproteobacteria bacterium]|nr:tRNA uridine-5-carboxymethylaminomethyl(34) synthesis GTPase MnmE [Gammaproteobacteria bacterium]
MSETICAIATPPGRGGIGIVRISGPACRNVAQTLLGNVPPPRSATHSDFCTTEGEILDSGIALYFPSPASYTGEDVLELQGHGSPVALDRIVGYLLEQDVRLANPGEFTERAFRNDKLDLAQAEAVADLIASGSAEAARAATRSLSGEFSRRVRELDQGVLMLRIFIESAIDFAEEEIDFLGDQEQQKQLAEMQALVESLIERSSAGLTMQLGLDVAIAGDPNVGKSSLLNQLLGEDRAIVTATAGTTRDTLHGELSIDGLPVRLTDTAGLRESDDPIEVMGMERAEAALEQADCVLWVVDDEDVNAAVPEAYQTKALTVSNKCDLTGREPGAVNDKVFRTCALTGAGLDELREGLKGVAGFRSGIDAFAGRPRHIASLKRTHNALVTAANELSALQGELVAENLRVAHECLGEIVGVTTSDDLLGEIFATFCIGK